MSLVIGDHYGFRPLKWLAGQKMEGLLYWAVALQEYNFKIVYRKGTLNSNADALSRRKESRQSTPISTAASGTQTKVAILDIQRAQQNDEVTLRLSRALETSGECPKGRWWRRYAQLWSLSLLMVYYAENMHLDQQQRLSLCLYYLNHCSKRLFSSVTTTLERDIKDVKDPGEQLRREAYWENMAQDEEQHCRECQKCQSSKSSIPSRAPLANLPIGRPWQMVAIDILEVPVSTNNNKYLLVIQDYFTKWADAIPLQNHRAATLSVEMVKVFCTYSIQDIVHSDQGRNFESTAFRQTLEAFGVEKSHTTVYHPEGDGMVEGFNCSLLQLLCTYVEKEEECSICI